MGVGGCCAGKAPTGPWEKYILRSSRCGTQGRGPGCSVLELGLPMDLGQPALLAALQPHQPFVLRVRPHADPLPAGHNSSLNGRHFDENHLSLSLWGSPDKLPDYQLDHAVLPSTALSCPHLGSALHEVLWNVKGSPRCMNMFLHGDAWPQKHETSFTIFCYKCSVILKDEFRLMNLKVLLKPSSGDMIYPCCDHTRHSSIWLFSAQNQRDTSDHKNKPSGLCNVLLQPNKQVQKRSLCP